MDTGNFVRPASLFNTMSQKIFMYPDLGIPWATHGDCNESILECHPNSDTPPNAQLHISIG